MSKGIVYLVGAGPGDPGLITNKGLACIATADCIVYDYLVNPVLLDSARPDAEVIYAGKMANKHTLKQPEINELLAEKAAEGKIVCRLKGGDPFVFGRGGEEALHLKERGMLYEVVPGVSAAGAVPAYAGIPITHRGYTSTFAAITGHEDPTKDESDIDWAKISTGIGTLVFFMGVRNLPDIAKRLIENGRPASTPVALIRRGTTPEQETVTGTLENIADRVKEAGLRPPALIVVGEVVALREELNWFENRPLFGKRIVVTRARKQASDFAQHLEALGADVIQFPTIRIEPPKNLDALRLALAALDTYDWAVFTSVNGVDMVMTNLFDMGKDARAFGNAKICAIGPATCARLENYGLRPDLIPEKYVAESVLESLVQSGDLSGKRFLLPRADIARSLLPKSLEEKGATVDEVAAYRTVPEDQSSGRFDALLEQGNIDLITFTSSSTAKNFVELVGPENLARVIEKSAFASIGPITTKTMKELNLPVSFEAEQFDIPGLIQAVVNFFCEKGDKA